MIGEPAHQFLQFRSGDDASGRRERTEQHLDADGDHLRLLDRRAVPRVFRDADERGGERAESVRERGELRECGHRHALREHAADDSADDEADENPFVRDDLLVQQRADDREQHADLREVHPAARGVGMAETFQPDDEKDRGEEVAEFDEVVLHGAIPSPSARAFLFAGKT